MSDGTAGRPRDRGVSVTLNYVLALGISAILVTGLLIAGGGFVEDTRERVVYSEMTVIGNHIAGNLEQADRLVQASSGDTTVQINESFQRQVTGATYQVELNDSGTPQVVVTADELDASVEINMTVQTDLDETTSVGGGTIAVVYDQSNDQLKVTNANI
jgi:hypothetical protein